MSFWCFFSTKMPSIRVNRTQCVTLCHRCSACAPIEPFNLCRRISCIFVFLFLSRIQYEYEEWNIRLIQTNNGRTNSQFYFISYTILNVHLNRKQKISHETTKANFFGKSFFLGFILIFICLIFGSSIENFTFRIVGKSRRKKEN